MEEIDWKTKIASASFDFDRAMGLHQEKVDYIPHKPTERQKVFLSLNDEREVFFGGAAGGGKSDALLMAALEFVHEPTYAAILFRRTYANLSKPGALMDRAIAWLKGKANWNEQKKIFTFPSGAKLAFGHLENENDKLNYSSAEFQFIGFDELTEFSETQYRFMFSRLRRNRGVNIPLRMRSGSNPPQESSGEWVREYFVPDDYFFSEEDEAIIYKESVNEDGNRKRRVFVPSRLEHNPHVDQEDYDESLSFLDDVTRHKLRLGDWRIKQRGEILWMYSDEHVCISWSQFNAAFGVNNQIPNHWLKSIYMDAGTTPGHPNITSFLTTAGQNAPVINGISMRGVVFLYRGQMTYQATTDEIAQSIWDVITPANERDSITRWEMSHEASSERMAYRKKNLPFNNWQTGRTRGIPQLQNAFSLRSAKLPHPFKPHLRGHPMLFFVVDNAEMDFPKTDAGLARWRAEAPAYKNIKPKSGEEPNSLLPHPLFNDAMDTLRAAAADYFPRLAGLSDQEKRELQLSPEVRAEHIQTVDATMQERLIGQRMIELGRIREKENKQSANAAKFRPTVPKIGLPSGMRRR